MNASRLVERTVPSPVGPLRLVASDEALVAILFEDHAKKNAHVGTSYAVHDRHPVIDAVVLQLRAYFGGTRERFDVPLAPEGTPFQNAVWSALVGVPFGETLSYSDLAGRVGRRAAVRAVGAANGRNPLSIVVPCHRIVGKDGTLTGYAGGVDRKAWLLAHEARVRTVRSSEVRSGSSSFPAA
ncbi:MAG: methylated-DNA--[protein]-cysteine S-methyltransferase [Polyangiaceae bacterium]